MEIRQVSFGMLAKLWRISTASVVRRGEPHVDLRAKKVNQMHGGEEFVQNIDGLTQHSCETSGFRARALPVCNETAYSLAGVSLGL